MVMGACKQLQQQVMLLCRHGARLWKGAGVAAPVFALRSRRSVGCGEFLDIKLLVDICHGSGVLGAIDVVAQCLPQHSSLWHRIRLTHMLAAGMRLVQLLPVNDTSVYMSWWDSYPYCTLSVRVPQLRQCFAAASLAAAACSMLHPRFMVGASLCVGDQHAGAAGVCLASDVPLLGVHVRWDALRMLAVAMLPWMQLASCTSTRCPVTHSPCSCRQHASTPGRAHRKGQERP